MQNKKSVKLSIFIILALSICGLFVYFVLPFFKNQIEYNSNIKVVASDSTTPSPVSEVNDILPFQYLFVN